MSSNDGSRPDTETLKRWLDRLKRRDPRLHAELSTRLDQLLQQPVTESAMPGVVAEGVDDFGATLETIVREGRPALLINGGGFTKPTEIDQPSKEITDRLLQHADSFKNVIPLVGRIDVGNFPGGATYLGTGWLVDPDVVVTNRHVAELIARWEGGTYRFRPGRFAQPITAKLDYLHESGSAQADAVEVDRIIWIEPDPKKADIAFLKLKAARRIGDGTTPNRIVLAAEDARAGTDVAVIGYPARAPADVIPDQDRMDRIYGGRYDVKRIAPGLMDDLSRGWATHDCTTLGGNSGSVVVDMRSGEAVALHFAGLYLVENYAVPASTIRDYIRRKPWTGTQPERARTPVPPPAVQPVSPAVAISSPGSLPISLTITLNIGGQSTTVTAGPTAVAASSDPRHAEAAVAAFWEQRPEGVIAARVGFLEDGDEIGDTPYIAASVRVDDLPAVEAAGTRQFQGFEVRYAPATVDEQVADLPALESVDSISYDDEARSGPQYSFAQVNEEMTVRAHVGPEYSWDELHAFLADAKNDMVSAIYEFHAPLIKDALEDRLNDGASLTLVMDNATFSPVKDDEFDRREVFDEWADKFKDRFKRIVAPEGRTGLISDSYHIKVTVRHDDTFWLSSGNWKAGSSQPPITPQERAEAEAHDLPGNREWHVVIHNKTLADRFRSHILQDYKHSTELGGGPVPIEREAADIWVDVPIEEAIVLERRPPSRLVEPQDFTGKIKVRPLLTPDREGAVYSEAVLDLIRSARTSLLFQIPYIGMPSNPRQDRGYIDALIKALTDKLKTLDDARVILRTGGSRLSDPTHAAWYFKSKGVDIAERLRRIDNHHTKGMIVDGKRVLIGSHNWSKPGVTLNRDASLIFDNADIAGYYAQAFEIDWERSNPIKPKRFVKTEAVIREAVGAAPPVGFRRMRLSDLLKEED